ncbi:MAG: GatB/YqeY domain-containing protein [Deltaproteobacteria bacterium]|nr:GatB/YqeY domain-containing protein [Deltaproteobacteria bacterium]
MKSRISEDIKAALKAHEAERLSTLRMILAELQYREKEKGEPVDVQQANQILKSMVRKRKEAIEQFSKGGREDLVRKEQTEIVVIEAYLPEQLSEDLIREHAVAVIAELGVTEPREMGKVMGVLTKKLAGQADGGTISRIVREELQKSGS